MIAVVGEYEDAELQQHTAPEMRFELEREAMRRRLLSNNEGILRPGALHKIRTLQVLEFVPLGNALSDRALKEVPGAEHIQSYIPTKLITRGEPVERPRCARRAWTASW